MFRTALIVLTGSILLHHTADAQRDRSPVSIAAAWGGEASAPVRSLDAVAHGRRQEATAPAEPIHTNDNRAAAGTLADGVLTIRLEAREGMWHPEGPDGPAMQVAAFAEEGGPLQNPGPLIRVPAGTEVRAAVRNTLEKPMTLFGFGEMRGLAGEPVVIAPGESREVHFRATTPGTYYYAGQTTDVPVIFLRATDDSQLHGAIVVDPPGEHGVPRDRVFVISWWFTEDPGTVSGLGPNAVMTFNGLSWPHTEHFDVTQGDSLHWRWINMTVVEHPLHLHGFYFTVDGKGDGVQYRTYAPGERRMAVTELMQAGETMALSWSPARPGNWIFHCHFAGHMSSGEMLEKDRRMPATRHEAHAGAMAAQHGMAGLILGIRVAPRGSTPVASGPERPLRLLIRSGPRAYGEYAGYAYVLGGSPQEQETGALPVPGPTLVLERDQPVAITVINHSHEPAAVHWHGIELESFPDGVPGWSGEGSNLLPAIPPHDSLTVRFTPPRSGTFMYHSHFNEFQQIGSGLYGTILVLDPGERHDPERDRILLFSDGGPTVNLFAGPFPPPLLNGQQQPQPLDFRAGETYRLRLINIRTDWMASVALLDGDQPVEWLAVAKDGADLPAAQRTPRPAELTFGAGEIYDFEFTPAAAGELKLRFTTPMPPDAPQPEPTVVAVRVH